jgi:hypothetical protein
MSCAPSPQTRTIPVESGDGCFGAFGCGAVMGGDLLPGAVCAVVRLQRRTLTVLHGTGKAGSDSHTVGLNLNLVTARRPVESLIPARPPDPK